MSADPTSPEGLAALEALARAATPGPWEGAEGRFSAFGDYKVVNADGVLVAEVWPTPDGRSESVNAAHIAAFDPPTVLALIARIREMEAGLRDIAGLADYRSSTACRCGHKPEFCHVVNADKWCGGVTTPAVWKARDLLGNDA